MGGTTAAPCEWSLNVFGNVGWKVGSGQPGGWGAGGAGSGRQPSPHTQRVWIWS